MKAGGSVIGGMSHTGRQDTQGENSMTGGVDMGSSSNLPLPDKVDLNDLDWEDRERVLRLLFSKINSGVSMKTA